jgi:alpha-L-arabinofuranosidase
LVTVNTATAVATVSPVLLGANMAGWFDQTQSGIAQSLRTVGFTATRYPGGSTSDTYHWEGTTANPASPTTCGGGYVNPNSTFDNFMTDVARPANLDVAITLNYGSNEACNGGGDPTEAAAWVNYSNNTKGYGVHWWTVGNEVFGSWEYDLHAAKNDATTYANAVATGYYPDIKARDSSAMVGVVVEPGWSPAWDPIVLANAKYDFVELHWYAQNPGSESDTYLLKNAPASLASTIASLKSELATAGKPNVPIFVGELGSVSSNPGKQTMSITQALFAAQVVGTLLDNGIARSTWWLAYGGCGDATSGANFSSVLYGWQSFSGYQMLSDGLPEYGCSNAPTIARGTLLPTAIVYQIEAAFAHSGERVFVPTVDASLPNVRAYATSQGTGYNVLLVNLDENNAASVPIGVSALASGSSATITTYGKAQYDQSQSNVWTGSVTSNVAAWHSPLTVSLPAWSVTLVSLKP